MGRTSKANEPIIAEFEERLIDHGVPAAKAAAAAIKLLDLQTTSYYAWRRGAKTLPDAVARTLSIVREHVSDAGLRRMLRNASIDRDETRTDPVMRRVIMEYVTAGYIPDQIAAEFPDLDPDEFSRIITRDFTR